MNGNEFLQVDTEVQKRTQMTVVSMTTFLMMSFVSMDMGLNTVSSEVTREVNVSSPDLPHYWLTSYDDARRIAATNKLPLLLHFDATWCGACRRMDQDVLNKNEVTSLLGNRVIGVKIDADRFKNLISEFGISTLPTEVVVYADGTQGSRYVGATSLGSYVARLESISSSNDAAIAHAGSVKEKETDSKNFRSCLIVRHDGKMVGVGGYSPVALTDNRQWLNGSSEFVATHEGVDYFLQSAQELEKFNANPKRYVPRLHGCDLVELHRENRATAGAIEYGAFYNGQVFFFASLENRSRFETNPTWYMGAMTDASTANDEMFPFLQSDSANN